MPFVFFSIGELYSTNLSKEISDELQSHGSSDVRFEKNSLVISGALAYHCCLHIFLSMFFKTGCFYCEYMLYS